MKNLICIDLMNTIVKVNYSKLSEYVDSIQSASEYQKDIYKMGFPYAGIVNEGNFNYIRDFFLTHDQIEIPSMTDKKIMDEILGYSNAFVENCYMPSPIISTLRELSVKADLVLVSNLYSIYSGIIEKFGLQNYFSKIILSNKSGIRKPSETLLYKTGFDIYKYKYYIGDNWKSDVIPANNLGFNVLYLNDKDSFISYVYNSGIQCLIEKAGENFRVKNKYKKYFAYYFEDYVNIENIKPDNLVISNNKVLLKKTINIAWGRDFGMINDIIKGNEDE